MAGYEIAWTPAALRNFDELPEKVAFAILEFATATLTQDPLRVSKPLKAPFDGLRSARRGQYRVILSVDEQNKIVLIHAIKHRNIVYFKS
jgi:mRNA-degrading endonuclease RelE of RelBE toxin-antitoxin system